ncbi:hypothetical protein [Pseudooceanicola aestuarii]|uniref:hypothetical protein n=1 Tax=Pseudooceanicola aestuarii TaxID=2697319 RepID=UPI0013D0CC5C|nr:hypothetical protein [Pseudooceanicola aestuarii]
MSRLILLLLVLSALVAVATLALAALGGAADHDRALPTAQRRAGALQKTAYGLLVAVLFGVGSGWMGGE